MHRRTQQQPSPPPQHEGSATNIEGPSYANRDVEVERLREQVDLLQRNVEKDKELLCRKDEELHHQRGLSHLVILEEVSAEGVMEIEKGIGDHPILMRNERRLLPEIEQFLCLLTRLGRMSRKGGS